MNNPDFDFEFYTKVKDPEDTMRMEAVERLMTLAEGHRDMIGASVRVEPIAVGEEPAHLYEARVVAYTKPNHIAAREKDEIPMIALKNALSAAERQVREKREKMRNP